MRGKNAPAKNAAQNQLNEEKFMSTKKSHLYYSATLKDSGRNKVLSQVARLTHQWINESDLEHCLCRAAEEFAAEERTDICADVVPFGRSDAIGSIALEIDDFIVHDTEPDDPVLVTFPKL